MTQSAKQKYSNVSSALFWQCLWVGLFYYFTKWIFSQVKIEGPAKIEVKVAKDIDQKLSDVRGVDEIKEELENVIKMLQKPEVYREKGCKLHKGIMLFGEPGTGKTLIARAIAGESGCNFIFCSGSDFDEMFVGVGAARVRKIFKTAREM